MICILHVETFYLKGITPISVGIEYLEKLPRSQPTKKRVYLNVQPRRIRSKLCFDLELYPEVFWDVAQAAISCSWQLGWRSSNSDKRVFFPMTK